MKKNLVSAFLTLSILLSGAQSLKCTRDEAMNIRGVLNTLFLHGSLEGDQREVRRLADALNIDHHLDENESYKFMNAAAHTIIFGNDREASDVVSKLNNALLALGAGSEVVKRDRNFYAQSFLSYYHFDQRSPGFKGVKQGIGREKYKENSYIKNFKTINGVAFKDIKKNF